MHLTIDRSSSKAGLSIGLKVKPVSTVILYTEVTHIIVSNLVTNQIDLDYADKMSFDETTKVLQRFSKPCSGLQRLRFDQMSFDETIQM